MTAKPRYSQQLSARAQSIELHCNDERQQPHCGRANQRQLHRVLQAQHKHFVFPDIDIVGQSHKFIFVAAIGNAVIYAAKKGHNVEQQQSEHRRQQKQIQRFFARKQRKQASCSRIICHAEPRSPTVCGPARGQQ